MLAVVCKEVKKTYGEGAASVTALRGVNLEVFEGELLMLVGPSGAGKTTLISIIAGILTQSEGDCIVFGQDINRSKEKEKLLFRAANLGFVFQTFNLIPMLTATENVSVPLLLNGMEKQEALEKSKEFLIQVGLEDKLDILPPQLSTGQQQRVAIARACIHNPRLIVCDEPTSALDHETGMQILKLLKETALQKDRALIVVTHDARVLSFADRIAKIDDGRIVSVEQNKV